MSLESCNYCKLPFSKQSVSVPCICGHLIHSTCFKIKFPTYVNCRFCLKQIAIRGNEYDKIDKPLFKGK